MATTGRPTKGRVVLTAIYCRISDDREGTSLGVQRQEKDCRELAEQRGWVIRPEHVYIDNDRGASNLSKKKRPAYEKMVDAIQRGHVNAIAYYSNSRLTRRPAEWLQLIQMVNTHGLKLANKVSGQYDLTTADGRAVALTIAAWDAAEAERTGERQKAKQQQMRDNGQHHGGRRVFGYAPAIPGERGSREALEPREAEALQAAAKLILAGGTAWQVMNQWNKEGLLTATGKTWRDSGTIKRSMLNPTIAGLLMHQGEIIGNGDWPVIIDRTTQEALRTLMDDRLPKRRVDSARHILSGLVFCTCGGRMLAQVSLPHHDRYTCMSSRGGCGKVARNKPWLEARVDEALRYLMTHQTPQRPANDLGSLREAELNDAIAHLEKLIVDTKQGMTDGLVPAEDGWPQVALWRANINDARKQLASITIAQARAEKTVLTTKDALAIWSDPDADFDLRRRVLESHISRIVVKPLGRGGWGANRPIPTDSIEILPLAAS